MPSAPVERVLLRREEQTTEFRRAVGKYAAEQRLRIRAPLYRIPVTTGKIMVYAALLSRLFGVRTERALLIGGATGLAVSVPEALFDYAVEKGRTGVYRRRISNMLETRQVAVEGDRHAEIQGIVRRPWIGRIHRNGGVEIRPLPHAVLEKLFVRKTLRGQNKTKPTA